MKKILLLIVLFILIIGIIFALCKIAKNNSTNQEPGYSQTIVNKITYSIDNGTNLYNSDYSKRGYYVDALKQPDSPWWYTIAMGEKNSGGYSINIENVNIDDDKNVEVIVKENTPKPGEVVTMALTYPICKLTLSEKPNSIVVKNTYGEEFEFIGWK